MKRTKFVSLILAAVLLLSMSVPAFAVSTGLQNFKPQTEYTGFSDVADDAWYAESVKTVCEYGLMKGKSDDSFDPNGYITIAETLALTSRLHNIYRGGNGLFPLSDPWYEAYDTYADENSLSASGLCSSPLFANSHPTRELFAAFVSESLPVSEFKQINDICSTESTGRNTADRIQMLFNAGVLTGKSDGTGFAGGSVITRAEVATILARMVIPSQRVHGRPIYILNTAKGVIWAKRMKNPGDMAVPASDVVLRLNEDYTITATINGIKYDVIIDEEAARQDPEWPSLAATYLPSETNTPSSSGQTSTSTSSNNCDYIINTNTNVFHYTWCRHVSQMSESNKWYYSGTRESVIAMGYRACGHCNP